ncbi:hypothetical protein [Rhodococcus sp. H29-C3]|uniref:hypothetical protein n=1 Tax=Rhodococcus sp. H29-C3 TaxID=3046307 RepID=UPI0024BA0A96|nr:hypothetical protein [Rhodococcus sp. H29-C3]MDJ0363338.1 hypothetical protein [Rhodococcus sp. H29-C3]
MLFTVAGLIALAVTAIAAGFLHRSTAHPTFPTFPTVLFGALGAMVLLTIGAWTTLTDTHNIAHWLLKIIITLVTITAAAAVLNDQRASNSHTRNDVNT